MSQTEEQKNQETEEQKQTAENPEGAAAADTTPTQSSDDAGVATTNESETVPAPAEPTPQEAGWPGIKAGMVVKIHQRIKDVNPKGEERERTQIFEGLVIARRGGREAGATVTVRKQSFGIGVEKIFPVHLPAIQKIEVIKQFKTRRAKLYYTRTMSSKKKMREIKNV